MGQPSVSLHVDGHPAVDHIEIQIPVAIGVEEGGPAARRLEDRLRVIVAEPVANSHASLMTDIDETGPLSSE